MRTLLCILAAATAVSLAGCGDQMPTLTGNVTVDGQPPPPELKGTISFEPVAGGAATAFSVVAADGSYQAMTGSTPGLAAGEYRVKMALPLGVPPPDNPTSIKFWAPLSYNNYETSGLTVTVEKGRNTKDFELSSK